MLSLTPGLHLLFRIIFNLAIPAVCISSSARLTEWLFASHVPNWAVLLAWIAYLPVTAIIRSLVRLVQEERDIRRLGAIRIPHVNGWLPGNLDVLKQLTTRDANVYMCNSTIS